jgi:SET domain-containing protein
MQNPSLILSATKHGQGVFAGKNFEKGEILLEFKGKIYSWPDGYDKPIGYTDDYDPDDDHFLQVGKDLYMGPSGDLDDYVNHSCDPSTGVYFRGKKLFLIAIRKIYQHEEITWDYSTNMYKDNWTLRCSCGASNCRGIIREFKYLPRAVRQKYLRLDIVFPFVIAELASEDPDVLS